MIGTNESESVRKSTTHNIDDADWVKFEKGGAKKIDSKPMDPTGSITKFAISLMRVGPGGEFPPHTDPYSHLFYVISGSGQAMLGKEECEMESGRVLIVKAGEEHGYRNTGKVDMYLITMNIA